MNKFTNLNDSKNGGHCDGQYFRRADFHSDWPRSPSTDPPQFWFVLSPKMNHDAIELSKIYGKIRATYP